MTRPAPVLKEKLLGIVKAPAVWKMPAAQGPGLLPGALGALAPHQTRGAPVACGPWRRPPSPGEFLSGGAGQTDEGEVGKQGDGAVEGQPKAAGEGGIGGVVDPQGVIKGKARGGQLGPAVERDRAAAERSRIVHDEGG